MGDIGVQYHALKIFQLNTAKVTASGNALARIMGAHRHSLAFITEPPIAFNKVCGFPAGAFNVLHHPKEVKRCRAAIVASKGVDVMALPAYTDEDTVSAITSLDGKDTCIVSTYMDIKSNKVPEMVHKVAHYAAVSGYGLLICTDANAHSPLWGSPDINQRGKLIEEDLIYRYGLQLLNVGSSPTYIGHLTISGTIIDLTLATHRTAASLSSWEVSDKVVLSDHSLITFQSLTKVRNNISWNFRKCDWAEFTKHAGALSKEWVPVTEWFPETIDEELATWYHDVNRALKESCPKTKGHGCPPNKRGRTCPWWSSELEALKKKSEHNHRVFWRWRKLHPKGTPDPEGAGAALLKADKDSMHEYKQAIRQAKRASWKKTTSTIRNPAEMARFCRGAFRKHRISLGLVKRQDGQPTTSPEESVKVIMDTLFPNSKPPELMKEHRPESAPKSVIMENGPSLFSDNMLQTAFRQFGSHKAAGTDGIKPIVFLHLDWDSRRRLAYIMEASTRLAYIPTTWRISRIALIPKPDKEDYADAKAWRPIAVLQSVFKVHEQLQKWLLDNALRESPSSDTQHAFEQGRGRGTETAIAEVVNYLEQTARRDLHCIYISLDVDGAFNKTNLQGVVAAMRERNFPDLFTNWYEAFVLNQTALVDTGMTTCTRRLTMGVPQGSITSPLAWNVYFEPILRLANAGPGKVVAYADDMGVIFSGIDADTVRGVAQSNLNAIVKFGKERGIAFNPKKTEVMYLGGPQGQGSPPAELTLNGVPLPYTEEVTYLGLKLNNRLDWRPHLDAKINAAKTKLMLLKTNTGKYWGPKPALMLWAYKQVVLPSLCYGCVVFAHTLDEPRLAKLRRLNRLALQLIAPFAPSTPTGGLEVITDTPPHSHRNAEKKHEHHPQDRKAQTNLGWDHVERLKGVLQTLVCPNPRHAKPSATKQVPHPI